MKPTLQYVRGTAFPATRDELVNKAKENNAPESAILAIESLPQEWFESMAELTDVAEAIGETH